MKKRVVPFETVETFLDMMRILFLSSPRQPDYDGIKDIFMHESFEIDYPEEESDDEE